MIQTLKRKESKHSVAKKLLSNQAFIQRAINNKSFFEFFKYFWKAISNEELVLNWHIEYLCNELQEVSETIFRREPKKYDIIINIPPGTTKTTIVNIMWPAWLWTRDYTIPIISTGYSGVLSLESAEKSRDLIRHEMFTQLYPELTIKADKDVKSNFKIVRKHNVSKGRVPMQINGGNRFSTSVGGTLTGFHGLVLIVDDPLNPFEQHSEKMLKSTNAWIDQVLSTRKSDKAVTVTVMVMQRIHENDPTGHILRKKKANLKHVCLPGDINVYGEYLKPADARKNYVNGLLDPVRMSPSVLKELEADLGQYGYAGQIGQNPVPPGGGMFKVENMTIITCLLPFTIIRTVRYWDKAGTTDGGAYTVGCKMAITECGRFIVLNVKRKQVAALERERMIKQTAEEDGYSVSIAIEQEPGSGGKESAEATVRNLAGFSVITDRPTGDKVFRADPYSVQVNSGNVLLMQGEWNHEFTQEHKFFPFGTYKDQVDAGSGAFNQLRRKKQAKAWGK